MRADSGSPCFALAAGNTNPQGIADPPAPETATAVTTAVADIAHSVGSNWLNPEASSTGGSGRAFANHNPVDSGVANSSRQVHSARADLLLACEQVFDDFDHKPLGALDRWARSTDRKHEELDCGDVFEERIAKFDLALDAAFASVE